MVKNINEFIYFTRYFCSLFFVISAKLELQNLKRISRTLLCYFYLLMIEVRNNKITIKKNENGFNC